MELAFENKLLRTLCENEDSANDQFGAEVSAKLKTRLADFRAAKNVSELIVGNPRKVKSNSGSVYKVDLNDNYAILFSANHVDNPKTESGDIIWSKVNRIKILSIEKL